MKTFVSMVSAKCNKAKYNKTNKKEYHIYVLTF